MSLAWWEGLLLGVVQGLSEFLPISSSGHLVVGQALLGFSSPGITFEIMVHVATLLSVIIVYRERIVSVLSGMVRGDRASWGFAGLLVLGSVPAAAVGIGFRGLVERHFHSTTLVGVSFLITALVLWSTRWTQAQSSRATVGPLDALAIGAAQAVAILPGISRSGTTIATALWGKIGPHPAAEFSFLLSVIAIAGSGLLEGLRLGIDPASIEPAYAWAFGGALVSGVFAIRFLVRLLGSGLFHRFAPYCVAIGLFTLVWFGALGT